jgi:putative flippase GtrA
VEIKLDLFIKSVKYGAIASLGLIIDFALVIALIELFGIFYLLAVSIGFTGGLLVTFKLSEMYIFNKSKHSNNKTFILFGVIGVIGLLLLSFFMFILTGLMGLNYLLAKIISTVVVFAWNFLARNSLYGPEDVRIPYEL